MTNNTITKVGISTGLPISNTNNHLTGSLMIGSSSESTIASKLWASDIIGDKSTSKNKLYLVQPWQSKNPMKIDDFLWVSTEEDLISDSEIKSAILNKLSEEFPDVYLKLGTNAEKVKLVRRDVTLEINMGK